jgi:excisionase family DNA binding protein
MNESITKSSDPADDRPPALLTIEEARSILRISRWSLYQLINRRRLRTVTIGQRRLIAAEDLRAFIEGLRQEGASHGW